MPRGSTPLAGAGKNAQADKDFVKTLPQASNFDNVPGGTLTMPNGPGKLASRPLDLTSAELGTAE